MYNNVFHINIASSYTVLGPVVQSIVSLTSLLRGQLVKCFTTLLLNTLIFFVEKMRSFCTAKASRIFSTKNIGTFQILAFEILMLANDVVSFEHPGPDFLPQF